MNDNETLKEVLIRADKERTSNIIASNKYNRRFEMVKAVASGFQWSTIPENWGKEKVVDGIVQIADLILARLEKE